MDSISESIIKNYDTYNEDARLKTPYGILEEEHTRRLILKFLVSKEMQIFDVGAGTGPYTNWLADLGHKISYSDIVPKHVEIFRHQKSGISKNVVAISVEDARNLSYKTSSADLVILNGPLYHLSSVSGRNRVLREAFRVLKVGGKLLGFSITRLSGLYYALSSNLVFDDDYYNMVTNEIQFGVRDNINGKNKTFNQAYFHTQSEIENEFIEAGFNVEISLGVLGPAWNIQNLSECIKDAKKRERLLQVSDLVSEYAMHSPKIMTVGKKN